MTQAPGAPGIAPTWTSSAKDAVTTALGASRVWITLGHGIVNEVYWPSTGEPQLRDLGFIVAGTRGWFEVKRVARYSVSVPEPFVPLPRIVHEGPGYRLTLEVLPDPLRDSVLIAYRLDGDGVALYPLLAPHLGGTGTHNSAQAADNLTASRGAAALCVVADGGFARASAGFVGASDGWQDFDRNGAMTWQFDRADDGNVALIGELARREGVLALGFADTVEGARTIARSSLADDLASLRDRFASGWRQWSRSLSIPDAPASVRREAFVSATVLEAHGDRRYPGAIVASLSIPWGNTSDSLGGYHLVWTRDAVEAALALLAIGQSDSARRTLAHLAATQRADGTWSQNAFPDGRPYWTAVQLDEIAFPVLLAAKLRERAMIDGLRGIDAMVERAIAYLVANGPATPQDRWEEQSGVSAFTLAIVIAALVGARDFVDERDAAYLASLADYWNERIEDWTYVADGPLAARYGVAGYYVRIGPSPARCGLRGRIALANRAGFAEVAQLVGMEFLYLARVGLRDARDPRIRDSLRVADAMLGVDTPSGVAYRRYNEDAYGEHDDGSPFDGGGVGRAWPLLVGERGHYEVCAGRDPLPWLQTMCRMTGAAGLIPEQVWDAPPISERSLFPGKPTGSAMPLVWAHAEFLKLVIARERGEPVERLQTVARRYGGGATPCTAWHWRQELPFAALPAARDLVVDWAEPFALRFGFDGWSEVSERASQPLGVGRHGVRIGAREIAGRASIEFTCRMQAGDRWEGVDHQVRVTP